MLQVTYAFSVDLPCWITPDSTSVLECGLPETTLRMLKDFAWTAMLEHDEFHVTC